MSTNEPHSVELTTAWINRLRWFAIAGQIGTIAATGAIAHVDLPVKALAVVLAIEVLFAICCEAAERFDRFTAAALLGCMVVDVVMLTALLYFTGGPENPFNFLYLVHVTLSLVALGERAAWLLLCLSAAAFGALFFASQPLHMHGAGAHSAMGLHMQGMWVGFVVAGVFIVSFASRLTRSLAAREQELNAARLRSQHSERLASLATLAAGAAHELNTPLSTIAVVAKELERNTQGLGEEVVEDAHLIRTEIDRCRQILEQLSVDSGYAAGSERQLIALGEVLAGCDALHDERVVLKCSPASRAEQIRLHTRPLRLAINAVVDNALRAGDGVVHVAAHRASGHVVIEVEDRGVGMSPSVASRAFEPFFSEREGGMGLGLFLARGVAEATGGELVLDSVVGSGTTVRFRLPVAGEPS